MPVWVRLLVLPLPCCAALGKEVSFSGDFLLSKAAMRRKLGEWPSFLHVSAYPPHLSQALSCSFTCGLLQPSPQLHDRCTSVFIHCTEGTSEPWRVGPANKGQSLGSEPSQARPTLRPGSLALGSPALAEGTLATVLVNASVLLLPAGHLGQLLLSVPQSPHLYKGSQ